MRDSTIGRILGFFLLISAVMVFVAIYAARNISRSEASSDWVNHTHAVVLEVGGVLSALHAGDAEALSFVVNGDARDKAASREAFATMAEHLEVAKALTRLEPPQHDQVLRLETLANQRAEFAQQVITAQQQAKPQAVRDLLAADAGADALGEIQRVADKLNDDEMELLAERDRASYLQAQQTRWTVWSGLALDVLLLGGVAWLIGDDIKARRLAASALREANEQLDAKVRERTAELASANARLTTENLERRWANQALEHQLRHNLLIINSINDPVFVVTKAMNISRINSAVLRYTGWEQQDLINKPLSFIARLGDASGGAEAPLIDPVAHALNGGYDLQDQPATVQDKRGNKTPVRLALFPLRDRDKVVGGVVILRTIEQRHRPDREI
jgi:PAS domain S-box-containing protein